MGCCKQEVKLFLFGYTTVLLLFTIFFLINILKLKFAINNFLIVVDQIVGGSDEQYCVCQ